MNEEKMNSMRWKVIEPPGSPLPATMHPTQAALVNRVRQEAWAFCAELMQELELKIQPTVSVAYDIYEGKRRDRD